MMKISANLLLKGLVIQSLLVQYIATATWMKDILQVKFEGTSVFFSVDEADVQAKLDEYLLKHPAGNVLPIL